MIPTSVRQKARAQQPPVAKSIPYSFTQFLLESFNCRSDDNIHHYSSTGFVV
jgi:hypothetical protein